MNRFLNCRDFNVSLTGGGFRAIVMAELHPFAEEWLAVSIQSQVDFQEQSNAEHIRPSKCKADELFYSLHQSKKLVLSS